VLVGFSQLPSNAIAFVLGLFGRRVLGNEPAKTARAIEARNILALRDLEHEGDRLEREALTALFDGGIDPMVVIRWKDIYERLEAAIDACRHAGNTLEGLIVKTT
jgi:uncharacterized protein Yka (UPF0111/DUF47 family)